MLPGRDLKIIAGQILVSRLLTVPVDSLPGLSVPFEGHEVGHDVGELLFVKQDVHWRHGAGAEFVESLSQLRGWVDQTFVDISSIFTTGDAVHCRANDTPFIADLVTANTRGNGVFVKDVLAVLG